MIQKRNIVVIGIFVGLIVVVLLGKYYSGKSKTSLSSVSNSQSAQTILQSLQQSISTSAPIRVSMSTDWVDDNNQIVPLKGWSFGVGTAENTYIGKYGSFSDINEITETSLQPLKSAAESFVVRNGFAISSLNKRSNPLTTSYGYASADIKCLVSLSPQSNPFGDFFCGTIDNQELGWRKELVPVINPKNDPSVLVSVTKLAGNYAIGSVGGYASGSAWYAVRVDGLWKEVWEGQNIISCKPVKQYTIPKDMYGGECSDNY